MTFRAKDTSSRPVSYTHLDVYKRQPQHRKHLQEVRGLTDEQIERLGYKSTPPFYLCRSLTEKLRSRGCKVEGVPGFYVGKDDKWTVNFNSITAGIIIPARGIDGMIRGAQIRLDTPIRDQESDPDKSGTKYLWLSSSSKKRGVSSGSPVHFVGDPFARVAVSYTHLDVYKRQLLLLPVRQQ